MQCIDVKVYFLFEILLRIGIFQHCLQRFGYLNRGCREITGFAELLQRFERSISILGRSKTFESYGRHVAAMALHFQCLPTELEPEQVKEYLFGLQHADVSSLQLSVHRQKTLRAITQCRTAALGGHIDACDGCGNISISYNSCRNRHCPKCQGHKREQWIQNREADLLPCTYYHVVFTLPQELNGLALHQPKVVYDALFGSVWQTIHQFGNTEGVRLGMIAVLHTWGQNLGLHPHLHCIVPGGGVDKNGRWQQQIRSNKYLFSVKALSKVFRAKYVQQLREQGIEDKALIKSLFAKDWVVYAKRPFGGPKQVIEYLGRYTHKVAISNHRIQEVTENEVTFSYKDYKAGGRHKTDDAEQRSVYPKVCTAYPATPVCAHWALRYFGQQLEAGKIAGLAKRAESKPSGRKSKNVVGKMSVL